MLNTKSFLAVDFGAGSLKLAEFEINEAGGLRLKNFAIKPLGLEGAQEATREAVILKALAGSAGGKGHQVQKRQRLRAGLPRFFQVRQAAAGGRRQGRRRSSNTRRSRTCRSRWRKSCGIIKSSAPRPAANWKCCWSPSSPKSSRDCSAWRTQAKLQLQLCDASPAALCNAFRYNYGDLEDCTMLLDIGAKTSNLLFFEKGKVFSRSINLGANAITQDFANEAKLKFEVAEQIKIAEGFVSLGGAYEEPENPNQAAISKIARQFMTKLHIQVNQTMQFYRGQQGGAAPQRLFLSGGACIMPYTAQFFAEKLTTQVHPARVFQSVPQRAD